MWAAYLKLVCWSSWAPSAGTAPTETHPRQDSEHLIYESYTYNAEQNPVPSKHCEKIL